jgi:hypothetical protein
MSKYETKRHSLNTTYQLCKGVNCHGIIARVGRSVARLLQIQRLRSCYSYLLQTGPRNSHKYDQRLTRPLKHPR